MAGPALVYASALSIPFAIDLIAPQLAIAIDGDPKPSHPNSKKDMRKEIEAAIKLLLSYKQL